MLKKELKLQIEVKDIEDVKTFINTVEKYYYDLPKELQDTLIAFSEKGISGVNADDFYKQFGGFKRYATNIKSDKITRYNEALKSVTYVDDDLKEVTIYPETFWIKLDDKTVIKW